jgi:lipoic acid synthetase
MPTRPGWATLGAGVGCFVVGRLFGLLELYVVGMALLSVLGVSLLVVNRSLPRMQVRRIARPSMVSVGEPARVAEAVAKMNLRHCVITSVARDELKDGGASVWAATIRAIKHLNPNTAIEVLTPDWKGQMEHLDTVLDAKPDIFNHNLETVERLQKPVRVQARYDRSRSVLQHAKARGFTTKTGIMLGLGEREEEIEKTLRDIAADKTDILTIGQYLQPTPQHWKIARWVHPDEFLRWKQFGLSIGIGVVESGPMVRSSYHADEQSKKYTGEEHLNNANALAGA